MFCLGWQFEIRALIYNEYNPIQILIFCHPFYPATVKKVSVASKTSASTKIG